jgi:hypothetical protein
MHGGRTDIILGLFEDGWKFANENTYYIIFSEKKMNACPKCITVEK